MAGKITTTQEALIYDPDSLSADTSKRENNIKIFQEMITREEEAIHNFEYIISQIDPNHKDVDIINGNIEKIKLNIKTFKNAILEEKSQIEKDLEMIRLIRKSKNKKNN